MPFISFDCRADCDAVMFRFLVEKNSWGCLQEPMVDAVTAEEGHTYSLAAIQAWFATGKRTSPMTNLEIGTRLQPNAAVRSKVLSVLESHCL